MTQHGSGEFSLLAGLDDDEVETPVTADADTSDPAPPDRRHDGFTRQRRRAFLKALRKAGCVRDACRKAGISDSAAYKARRRDPEFARLWAAALAKAGGDLELVAWQRAVEGVEEEVIAYGKVVGTRRRYDAGLFRMLLQASNPEKYGGRGTSAGTGGGAGGGTGGGRAARRQVRLPVEAEPEPDWGPDSSEDALERISRKIEKVRDRMVRSGRYYYAEDGEMVPSGYVRAEAPGGPAVDGSEPPVPESGAEWTRPEPDSGAAAAPPAAREARNSADPGPAAPRIRLL